MTYQTQAEQFLANIFSGRLYHFHEDTAALEWALGSNG